MIRRLTDLAHLNSIANHREVHRWMGTEKPLDLAVVIERFIVLGTDLCYLIFVPICGNVLEVHTAALPAGRGKHFRDATREALRWVFLNTDALEIVTRCPYGNPAAVMAARCAGGVNEFHTRTADVYRLAIHDWIGKASGLEEKGQWFHAELERLGIPAEHEDDPVHDRYVGLALACVEAGQVQKGLWLYNRWAALSDYHPLALVSHDPLIADIGVARIAFDEGGRLKVI